MLPLSTTLLAETTLEERLQSAESRIDYLEDCLRNPDCSHKENTADDNWFKRLEVTGLIEVEASREDPDNGGTESNLTLATAELGIAARISSMVSGELVLLFEDDGAEDLDVDVATITLTPNDAWSLTAGQLYLPFGVYETGMISDPLTLELGEIRETAVAVGFAAGDFSASAYLFDGDASENGNAKIDNFGVNLAYSRETDSYGFSASLDYINDIGDTDGLIDYAGLVHERVAGYAFSSIFTTGPFSVIGEYVGANEDFTSGEKPSAYNLEAGYAFELFGRQAGLALGYQGTDDAGTVGLAETVVLTALSIELFEHAALAFEYANAEDYSGTDTDSLTIQLASEF